MIYDTNFYNLKPFTIVSAPYIDLEGNVKRFNNGDIQRGLFMIARVDVYGNVLAFKITSQYNRFINEYTYSLSQSSHTFLKTDSFIQLDKWHTLFANECTILGEVMPSLRMAILRKYDAISREVDTCLKDNMSYDLVKRPYKSPNAKDYRVASRDYISIDKYR